MQYDKNNSLSNNSNNFDYISDYSSYEYIPILKNSSNSCETLYLQTSLFLSKKDF